MGKNKENNPSENNKKGDQVDNVNPENNNNGGEKTSTSIDDKVLKQLLTAHQEMTAKLEELSKKDADREKREDALKKEIENLKSPGSTTSHGASVMDDYLEVPVVFFCFSSAFSLPSYKLRNKTVLPPDDASPIQFKPAYRYKLGEGAQAKYHALSIFTTRSKAEVEYIKNFPGFGFKIHERNDKGMEYDTLYADTLTKIATKVNAMTDHAVTAACIGEQIQPTEDLEGNRKALIHKRAKAEVARIESFRKKQEKDAAQQAINAASMLKDKAPNHYDVLDKKDLQPTS